MLKSLEIYGFKSFADRTRLDFSAGITGVVGPNGSGKSNVVDALKWILGDQSAKSLRGAEMTDVIFNGSASRKPSSFAEAFLTIDNSKGFLSIPATEVQIGRRLYRSGDAEYLINKAPSRLKDIRDLLLGSGAGNAAYCIIEQGRVDQILQANPTARRTVFEEAAGISRFKARRIEAQRKLERVAQNLQRLSDIVDEVEAQVNSTRSQAAKAVKYREVSEELNTWWLGLAADDVRQIHEELSLLDDRMATAAQRIEELLQAQRDVEQKTASFDRDLLCLDQELREAERRVSQNRERIASEDSSVKFRSARLQELDEELTRLQRQRIWLQQRVQESELQQTRQHQEIESLERETEGLRQRLTTHDDQLRASNAVLEQRRVILDQGRQQRQQAEQAVTASDQIVATLDIQLNSLQDNHSRLTGRWDSLREQQAAIEAHQQQVRDEYERLHQDAESASSEWRSRAQHLHELQARQQGLREALGSVREARSAAAARKSLLEDLELRQEGLGIGVRELLHRARHSQQPPWNTVVGSVADLLDVDLEHSALIEVALGARAEWIVLREYQPLLDYLARGQVALTGRVGFLAIPDRGAEAPWPAAMVDGRLIHIPRTNADESAWQRESGVRCRADQLIQSEHGVYGLAAAVLGDTWIVQDLETAVRLAQQAPVPIRCVTLQGELLDVPAAIQLGTIRSETSMLSRKSELRRIKNDLLRLDRELLTQESLLKDLDAAVAVAAAEAESHGAQQNELAQATAAALNALRAADQEADHYRREAELITGQLTAHQERSDQLQRQLVEAESRSQTARELLLAVQAEIGAAEESYRQAAQTTQEIEQRKAAEHLDRLKQVDRLEAARREQQRLADEIRQRIDQLDDGDQRLDETTQSRRQIVLQILKARAELAELYLESDRLRSDVAQRQAAQHELRQQRSAFLEGESQTRTARRELQEQRHADEIRSRELRTQLGHLAERLQEDFQSTPEAIAASGRSAYALFLQDRRGGEHASTNDDASALAVAQPSFTEVRPELEAHVGRLRRKLKLMGHVNTDSLRDLEQLEQRFDHLSSQLQDLVEAKSVLEDIIRRINHESRRMFVETFNVIRAHFQHLFRKVFGGGEGDIVLEDLNDVLECGIEITARPPGKDLKSLSLLSGGEKTMTAIAMIMAIFQAKPSPFCILDEVDAALDEANVDRFTNVIREFQQTTQFIMITHHKRSMLAADVLYGVTMEESGVSKRMSVRFDDIGENGEFRTTRSAA